MTSMLLNSVILVLQETLEAALLISVLLAISYQRWSRISWLLYGLSGGITLSLWYALQMGAVSEWFDYMGQEVVNAMLQNLIMLLIVVCTWAFFKSRRVSALGDPSQHDRFAAIYGFSAAGAVALSITREGSEVFLYLSGFFRQSEHFQAVMIGSSLGFGIGVSIGTLLFYGLLSLPGGWRVKVPIFLLALFAGNMLSQAALQLTQADWISSAYALWDTSSWLPENSIAGQLLYALVGYESTPTTIQVIAYVIGVTLVFAAGIAGNRITKNV
jgi:high-affinity iron transporter